MILFYSLILSLLSLKNCNFDFKNELLSFADDSSDDANSSVLVERMRKSLVNLISDSLMISLDRALNETNDPEEINELEDCKANYQIFNISNKETEKLRLYYIYLLYYESFKSKNDLGKYTDCVEIQPLDIKYREYTLEERKQLTEESTYYVFKIIEKSDKSFYDITYKNNEYVFGLCFKRGCSERAFKKLFIKMNEIGKFFNNLTENDFKVYDVKLGKEIPKFWLIPISIIILIILLNPLNYALKFCHINDKKKLIAFLNCFDFNINSKEILTKDKSEDSSNLNLLKGIRGITLIFIIVSCSFIYIYHLPTKVLNAIYISNVINSYYFILIYYGARFGKKILYALSGVELVCKMLHYLDESLKNKNFNIFRRNKSFFKSSKKILADSSENEEEEEKEEEEVENDINEKSINLPNINDNNEEEENDYFKKSLTKMNTVNDDKSSNEDEEENNRSRYSSFSSQNFENRDVESRVDKDYYEKNRLNFSNKALIFWFMKQLYKYFLFVIIVVFFKYGTICAFYSSTNYHPISILYFQNYLDSFTNLNIISNIFCFAPFSDKTFNWIDPFDLVYNEITFFIIGSLLIYVCYKFCFRLDIIILILSFLLLGLKIILGIFIFIEDEYYPSMFYQNEGSNPKYSYFSSNQLMNLHIFLLGMFVGEIHYCIYYEESKDSNKKYLILPKKFAAFFKQLFIKQNFCRIIITNLFLLILFVCYVALVFIYELMIQNYIDTSDNYTFFKEKIFNIICLFDSDVAVILFLFLLMMLFFNRDNIFSKFLEHKYWRILSMPYWSNLLFIHISTSYIFYYSEIRVKLIISAVIFISFQIQILLTLISCIFFILVEMPLKNITKLILSE